MAEIGGISGIGSLGSIGALQPATKPEATQAEGEGFGNLLMNAIGKVDALQTAADVEARKVATGQSTDLTEAIVASERAKLSMEFTVQVRNKIVESYQEIMRMPV